MDKAKAKVGELLHRSGQHDTSVHETVAPAVTQETVKPTRHEQQQQVVDKEVHQEHYHTSVQPVVDREVLPEQHTHQALAPEERHFTHGAPTEDKQRVATEAAKFKDQRAVKETSHSQSEDPTVVGEHVHHHVHETIQPVLQKETIQPEVVHTTKPVHEVHHNTAQHHETTALPAVSKTELEQKGGTLLGRGERSDHFAGEPKYAGLEGTGPATGADGYGTSTTGTTGQGTSGYSGVSPPGYGTSGTTGTSNTATTTPATSETKPSLMDKINPKKDATGDGQAGFMK